MDKNKKCPLALFDPMVALLIPTWITIIGSLDENNTITRVI